MTKTKTTTTAEQHTNIFTKINSFNILILLRCYVYPGCHSISAKNDQASFKVKKQHIMSCHNMSTMSLHWLRDDYWSLLWYCPNSWEDQDYSAGVSERQQTREAQGGKWMFVFDKQYRVAFPDGCVSIILRCRFSVCTSAALHVSLEENTFFQAAHKITQYWNVITCTLTHFTERLSLSRWSYTELYRSHTLAFTHLT